MKKGKWNYTEDIEYTVVMVKIAKVPEQPLHWQNVWAANSMDEIQAVKVVHNGKPFYIDNTDGSGLKKIAALGGPDSYSAHINMNYALELKEVTDETAWHRWDPFIHKQRKQFEDNWNEINHPEEYKKILLLRAGLADLRKKYKP
jgi:hypothetical protein